MTFSGKRPMVGPVYDKLVSGNSVEATWSLRPQNYDGLYNVCSPPSDLHLSPSFSNSFRSEQVSNRQILLAHRTLPNLPRRCLYMGGYSERCTSFCWDEIRYRLLDGQELLLRGG